MTKARIPTPIPRAAHIGTLIKNQTSFPIIFLTLRTDWISDFGIIQKKHGFVNPCFLQIFLVLFNYSFRRNFQRVKARMTTNQPSNMAESVHTFAGTVVVRKTERTASAK